MLRTRILTAIVLLALVAGAAWWSAPALQALFGVLLAVAVYEWLRLAGHGTFAAALVGAACAAGVVAQSFSGQQAAPAMVAAACAAACVLWIGLALLVVRANHTRVVLGRPLSTLLAAFVLGVGWLALTRLLQSGIAWLLSAMAIVWIADIGAYAAGRLFGRHKLAPKVSPGKTWEGVAGGMGCVAVAAGLAYALWPERAWWTNRLLSTLSLPIAMLVLWAVVALSIVGDLFESLLKRQAGVKDSGRLLPGHGGVLDRIDACLPALPAAALIGWWMR
jgi:phosphatidate cytidylyltransferase